MNYKTAKFIGNTGNALRVLGVAGGVAGAGYVWNQTGDAAAAQTSIALGTVVQTLGEILYNFSEEKLDVINDADMTVNWIQLLGRFGRPASAAFAIFANVDGQYNPVVDFGVPIAGYVGSLALELFGNKRQERELGKEALLLFEDGRHGLTRYLDERPTNELVDMVGRSIRRGATYEK